MFLESAADGFKVIIISALYTIIRINFNDLWFFIQLGILYFFNEWEKIKIIHDEIVSEIKGNLSEEVSKNYL